MLKWAVVVEYIQRVTDRKFELLSVNEVSGGDINRVYVLKGVEKQYFVKINKAELLSMFETEALGLLALSETNTLKIPEVITHGVAEKYAFLVLEYIELYSLKKSSSQELGQKLAELHQQKQSYFGWSQGNFIGHNAQKNAQTSDWVSFWQEQRLAAQLELAEKKGYLGSLQSLGQELVSQVPYFFDNYQPQASLLHGDLWSGNASATKNGQAIIYDPACYCGDREADIAMTELFGGFSADFYNAYERVWPLDSGYGQRKSLYNLYHILNHLNLFGRSYLSQAEMMMRQLLDGSLRA
ncbi:MAG: phosphotransferase [Methyloprofundus sp.]|nr:phosphotransferase [Methyloprofundus sp.]